MLHYCSSLPTVLWGLLSSSWHTFFPWLPGTTLSQSLSIPLGVSSQSLLLLSSFSMKILVLDCPGAYSRALSLIYHTLPGCRPMYNFKTINMLTTPKFISSTPTLLLSTRLHVHIGTCSHLKLNISKLKCRCSPSSKAFHLGSYFSWWQFYLFSC